VVDQFDRAQELEQRHRDEALKAQRSRPEMPFRGKCYNCHAPIKRGCFCDTDCRDDYEKRTRGR